MTTPYRQPHDVRPIVFCPRCNELLDAVDFGVDMCPRCEGFWITNAVLELSGRCWPAGPRMWWRNDLRCPTCASTNTVTTMTARASGQVVVDQCAEHGVWLDRGELSRVMADSAVQELAKLREHLAALEPTAEQLAERRTRWRAEQDARQQIAADERKRLAHDREKREAEEAEADHQRRATAGEAKLREAARLATARQEAARHAEAERLRQQAEDEARRAERERAWQVYVDRGRQADERELERRAPQTLDARAEALSKAIAVRDAAAARASWLETRVANLRVELANMQRQSAEAKTALAEAERTVAAKRATDT